MMPGFLNYHLQDPENIISGFPNIGYHTLNTAVEFSGVDLPVIPLQESTSLSVLK